jgi:hypothetical protein
MRNADTQKVKAEQEEAKSHEGLQRAFQSALDEANTSTLKFIFPSHSPVVDVLISAVVKVVSDLEYSETQFFATRVIKTFAARRNDGSAADNASAKLYGDTVIDKAREEVEHSHTSSKPLVGEFGEKKKPQEVEVP